MVMPPFEDPCRATATFVTCKAGGSVPPGGRLAEKLGKIISETTEETLVRRQLTVAIATLVLAASPVFAANGNIGLFFDQGAALCQTDVQCGGSTDMWVYGLLQGASQFGITGAEYAVGVSTGGAGWAFIEAMAAPTVIGLGAFPPNGGLNMAWPECQLGDGTKVLLETVHIINVSDCTGDEVILTVTKKFNASNQFFQCPLFTLCDAPVYTKVCLGSNLTVCQNPEPPFPLNSTCSTSGEAFLNPGPTRNCTVAVQTTSWSAVKGLYSN
jgi:hypothetical protein